MEITPSTDKKNEVTLALAKISPTLKISTTPAGALVAIEGISQQKKSTAVFRGLTVGKTYRVTIFKKGYEPINANVKLTDNYTAKSFTLKQAQEEFGYLSIGAIPYAEIYLDDKLIGYTPKKRLKVSVGKHSIRLKHMNAPDITKTVTVEKGKETEVIEKMNLR